MLELSKINLASKLEHIMGCEIFCVVLGHLYLRSIIINLVFKLFVGHMIIKLIDNFYIYRNVSLAPDRTYFSNVLRTVLACSALFEKSVALSSCKTCKTTCYLGGVAL